MKQISMDSFMDFRFLSSLTYSPDGGKLAYLLTKIDRNKNEYVNQLRMRDEIADHLMVSDGRIGEFFFEDDEHLLFVTDKRDKRRKDSETDEFLESTTLYRLPLNGGEAELAYCLPINAGNITLLEDGNLLMTGAIRIETPDLYTLDDKKRITKLKKLNEEKDYDVLTESPVFSNGQGMIQGKRNALFLYIKNERRLKRLTGPLTDVEFFRVHGSCIYYSGVSYRNHRPNRQSLYCINLETGKTRQILGPRLIIQSIECIQDTLIVIGATGKRFGNNENPFFYTFDTKSLEMKLLSDEDISFGNDMLTDVVYGDSRFTKADGELLYFTALERFGCTLKCIGLDGVIKTVVSTNGLISDYDVFNGKVTFAGMLDMKLPELYFSNNKELVCLTDWNTDVLSGTYIAQPHPLSAQLNDEEIDGWVLLPEKYDPAKRYPAILDIHGGPKCAYGPIFFHEMQVWVARGYIVFFCNPHGSDGRGDAFSYLDLQWGSIDFQQIMAFKDKVLEAFPSIDPQKLCCTGGSYGGYMSNWILGHTDAFCCIATQRSISNWITMYGLSDIPPISNFKVCSSNPYSQKGMDEMWNVSPLKYIQNAKTPTLIIHSEEDYRCPIAEAYQLYTALVYLRIPTRMVVFHGENHDLSRTGKPAHRLRRLKEITAWFDKYSK